MRDPRVCLKLGIANPFKHVHIPSRISTGLLPFGTTPSTSSTPPYTTPHLLTEPSHSWKTWDWMLTYGGTAFSRTTPPTFNSKFNSWKSNAILTTTDSSKPHSLSPTPEGQAELPPKSSITLQLPNNSPVPPLPIPVPPCPHQSPCPRSCGQTCACGKPSSTSPLTC